jgi:NADPH-dependent curcumin reductase CurA
LRFLAQCIRDGSLRYREEILEGLHEAPGAIARLYRGENMGKLLVRLVDAGATSVSASHPDPV